LTFFAFKRANRTAVTYAVFPVFVIFGLFMTAPPRYRLVALLLSFVVGAFPIERNQHEGKQRCG
jgi:hypothetical protein